MFGLASLILDKLHIYIDANLQHLNCVKQIFAFLFVYINKLDNVKFQWSSKSHIISTGI